MIKIDHHTDTSFNPEERHHLSEVRNEHWAYFTEVLRALDTIVHPSDPELVAAAIEVLRRETFMNIDNVYLLEAPKRDERVGKLTICDSIHNDEYERKLADRIEFGAFKVPVERALPLSYEAQCDVRAVTGEPRRNALKTHSDYAPLFTASSEEMSSEDKEKLPWLTPSENSPKEQTLARLNEKNGHYRVSDPDAKRRFNEPKQMPNLLTKKCSGDFVPEVYRKSTTAIAMRSEGNGSRVAASKAAVSPRWY